VNIERATKAKREEGREVTSTLRLSAFLLLVAVTPGYATSCVEALHPPPLETPLESTSVGQQEIRPLVEALLHDAETIYLEGAHIVARNPRTESEATALSRMEQPHSGGESFHIGECYFHSAFPSVEGGGWYAKYPREMAETLVRLGQFDNFIFDAANSALLCETFQARFNLKLARELLDHAWMEFRGHPEQRDWAPADLDGPQSDQKCVDDLSHLAGPEEGNKVIDSQILKFQQQRP
jgi:hypothetical protein